MNTKGIIHTVAALSSGIAFHTSEAATQINGSLGNPGYASFRHTHPVSTIFVDLMGVMIVLGLCALALSALTRRSGEN